jgi:hypothetical protein
MGGAIAHPLIATDLSTVGTAPPPPSDVEAHPVGTGTGHSDWMVHPVHEDPEQGRHLRVPQGPAPLPVQPREQDHDGALHLHQLQPRPADH